MTTLYLVVPCYNEQEVLPETAKRLIEKLESLAAAGTVSGESRILFVDDGSRDGTWPMIAALHERDRRFSGLKLSRNRGHQNALLAGLMAAKERADATISMDADLQDDIDAVDEMLERFREGCQIVYGVRANRDSDTAFKRSTAEGFYKFMELLGVHVVFNHADYRLMGKTALDALENYREVNLFLRGIVPLLGYKTATVEYRRGERFAGESKYPLGKMLALAWDGVTSFSVKPIRMITALGCFILAVSLALTVCAAVAGLLGHAVPWWPALMASVWILGGLLLLGLGVVGEYIGKIYGEVKARPRCHIEDLLDD